MITKNNEIAMFKDTLRDLGLAEYVEDAEIIKLLAKGIEVFGSNSVHVKVYENLTNNKLKCYSLLIWAISCETENERLWLLLNQLKQSFNNEDWQELIITTENVTAKIEYTKNIMRAEK